MLENSPYLSHPRRLSDVIAAIQVLGVYPYASRGVEKWLSTVGRPPLSSETWLQVFDEHPEFFRVKPGKDGSFASLVWRRAQPKTFAPELGRHLTHEELEKTDDDTSEVLSTTNEPLSPSQVTALVEVAIKLHTVALSQKQDRRWWLAPLAALAGVILGALLHH